MIAYSKLQVRVDLEAITHNYRLLKEIGGRIIPVIKSDAYGHGLCEVARALEPEGADTCAVGYVHEGVQLRDSGYAGRIISLLGPVDAPDFAALGPRGIVPFIGHADTLGALGREVSDPVDIALKFDTGMSRLGFRPEQLPEILDFCARHPHIRPVMVASHLAVADEPQRSGLTTEQCTVFLEVVDQLRGAGYAVEASLANSAAILGHEQCLCDSQRAGIALYGANPFEGTEWRHVGEALLPAMEVSAPVLSVHALDKGQGISYGHTYVAEEDMLVAVVGVGYADCYSRGLSNRGWMNFRGHRVPVVGRVCMQMTCVDVTGLAGKGEAVRVGDVVHLLGGPAPGRILPGELAEWWETIPYEVFCLLGMNPRSY
ncbi:alanine racemase [Salidesulfovibrio onnuriiensis]|uniref:alanine racemase n=1 Tax=Salidesulfovibrio onnuriiensis TaxID=2583823 RepID=UPI0011CB0625|nr:alanine racemase [Salidesulfovibrio onnuriiensis]